MQYAGSTLLTFVEYKDPFALAELAGQEQPGPVLSLIEARRFDHAFLFYTPQLYAEASATAAEIDRRYPLSTVHLRPLAVADPKDYSALMGRLGREVREIAAAAAPGARHSVCVSSGTAEMRAAWFLLTVAGVIDATLLQLGSPAEPLYGAPNVQEVKLDTPDWAALRDLVMPIEFFATPAFEDLVANTPYRSRRRTAAALTEQARALPAAAPAPPPELANLDAALLELDIFIGSALMRHAAERAAIAAGSHLPVLLHGETGTGKEVFARLIHRLSHRSDRPFIAVNCAAIPDTLVESHLFGHRKGAFTGAAADHQGKFQQAGGGTLFLDEIGELAPDAQAKLLRVLQEGTVEPVGGSGEMRIDVRILAATNRDLAEEVRRKRFRKDLYYRLEVVRIDLPPLRDRRAEIPALATSFLKRINQRRLRPRRLTTAALQRLEQHHWPGNVRELSNVLERSALYAPADELRAEDILIRVRDEPGPLAALPEPHAGFRIEDFLASVRTALVRKALARSQGNQSRAVELLGITRQSLSKYVKDHSIVSPD